MERINDNIVAIDMLKDVTKIIEFIERGRAREIINALHDLKKHTYEFENVFNEFNTSNNYD